MNHADLIINAAVIVTVDTDNRVLPDHSLVVKNGQIIDLQPHKNVQEAYQADTTVDRYEHILMPGLINTHCHLAMNLMRGLADDLPLMTWLQEHIWPVEAKWASPEFVRDGTALALAESLLGGVTCVNDMYFFPDQVAAVAEEIGMRATVGLILVDFPTAWASSPDEYLSKGLALHDQLKTSPLVNTAFAPHAPYTVSTEPLQRVATLSAELDIPVHMHIHETATEVQDFIQSTGRRPISALHDIGLLSPSLLAVHMTQMTSEEIALAAETGLHILHCPESNLKLASGACPVGLLIDQGVNVTLGTDGAASNNDLDMFGEMRTAALLAKHTSGDASTLPAETALRMATINGAKALGIQHVTGSLELGKAADCIAVDCSDLTMAPMYNAASHLVYCNNRSNVNDVWVNGKCLLENRTLTSIDQAALLAKSREWSQKINA